MDNFDEEYHPFEHRLPIDNDGITHNSCAGEGHAMSDQYDEPTPEQTDEFMNMNFFIPRGEVYQQATNFHSKRNSSGKTIVRRKKIPS